VGEKRMDKIKQKSERQAEIKIKFSKFELPPVQDALLVGREAPIGIEAVRRMLDAVAPEQYEVIRIDNHKVEGIVIKKNLLQFLPKERLVEMLIEEGEKIISPASVIKMQIDIGIVIERNISF